MDKFNVIALIGEGSFGRVYKATKKSDEKIVAIKIISKRGRANKELKNLRRECDIQAKLKHPNVIEMFESFETKNELVVVTEFAMIDLHRFLSRNGAITEEKAQQLTCQLVSALYYLHSNRILHRDLKPQNVLLNDDFHAKLCDFGLARNMTMGTHVLTSIKGTPLYMAPELLAEKPYDHQADLWSLGCIIYESMAGQPPFCTTSILHLVRLIKHEEVKWPSFLSGDCQSFLQGLLEKDPSLRMTWAEILCNPFVEGKLDVLEEAAKNSPFTNPKGKTTKSTKKKFDELSAGMEALKISSNWDGAENVTSSRDSINAIIQSDIENIETDVEELGNRVAVPFSDTPSNSKFEFAIIPPSGNMKPADEAIVACFVSGNPNLMINHLNDNFKMEASADATSKAKAKLNLNLKPTAGTQKSQNKDLEKRKLSQNLDNFSLRLGQTVDGEANKKLVELVGEKKKPAKGQVTGSEEKTGNENTPPCLLPGWDSCDESQSPPIENEEWLAFLHRSTQEVLDGELDSLRQQNLVSIIVAPLRNSKASPKVIESVAQLLSLPLALGGPANVLEGIKSVYTEVKLVPNLMYAAKLLASYKNASDSASSPLPSLNNRSFRPVSELSSDEIRTISRLYELACHLVHLKEQFLLQFCDAVAILAADDLFINFLSHDHQNSHAARISNCLIALLCCVVREFPENAELVERIVFNPKLDLTALMKNKNALLRSRMCMLFRLLGRFSLRGLQSVWTAGIRETIEALMYDSSEQVRLEAEGTLEELKHFSFYA